MKKKASVTLFSLLILCGSTALVQGLIGGGCSYDDYPGACDIVSILKTEDSIRQAEVEGGPGYEGYEVWFVFSPDEPMNLGADREEEILGSEHLL